MQPKFGRGVSEGYFASPGSQEAQEQEACRQVCVALVGLGVLFGLIGYMLYYFFRDVRVGSTQFFFLVAMGSSMMVCVWNLHKRGWNIFEMLGGRMGGAGG